MAYRGVHGKSAFRRVVADNLLRPKTVGVGDAADNGELSTAGERRRVGTNAVSFDENVPIVVAQAVGVTSSPSKSTQTPELIPEMEIFLITTGRPVLVTFYCRVTDGDPAVLFHLYRDEGAIGPTNVGSNLTSVNITYIDTPPAGLHKYQARWAFESPGTSSLTLTMRAIQAIEL